jgi:galactose mutarotase-like enzyme
MAERSWDKKENVLIESGDCAVTLLPSLGGKIASIRVNGCELLQAPLTPYAARTRTMSFDAGDASGWDECLPSVAACRVETSAGPVAVPDHGDLWRARWSVVSDQRSEVGDQGSVTLRGECFSLPLALERTLALTQTAKGYVLRLDYTVTNTGSSSMPWSWAAHPLFVAEAGDRIVLPDSIQSLRLEGSGGARLGKGGDQVSWPLAALARGGQSDLSLAQGPESEIGDKLFAGPLTAAENWCALERPRAGLRIKVGFDPCVTPYLGLWICYGGWPEGPGPKQVCVALEPATAPVDSLAVTGPWSRQLAPGESFSWPMTVEIELTQDVNQDA